MKEIEKVFTQVTVQQLEYAGMNLIYQDIQALDVLRIPVWGRPGILKSDNG
ncbi:hypothetical protein [Limnofasciculus baicalensis]|uniref:Uncharacterized protein n=1 Tax=Limnofasciculus baicalensis BBK-W-15 TaxID=2699891 RepID=A0AAE3KL42_9CYAN|nr:hypothetical protein [Limnofasciculus baicalensis]MCP2728145.1 hypothetical protein [Limnofasciculus baicalensis BBK-W-15]